jgi:hypothetical protein
MNYVAQYTFPQDEDSSQDTPPYSYQAALFEPATSSLFFVASTGTEYSTLVQFTPARMIV